MAAFKGRLFLISMESDTVSRLTVNQTEANYNGVGSNGTFVDGTGYNVADEITLSDGSVVQVDVVDVGGEVLEFTITTASNTTHTNGATLTQASVAPTGGTGFTLTPGTANEIAAYVAIATARGTDLTYAIDAVDVTHKGSNGYRTLIEDAGVRAVSISVEGVYENSDVEKQLVAVAHNGTFANYEIASQSGEVWSGPFQITNYARGGTYNGEETFSASFESAGPITFTQV